MPSMSLCARALCLPSALLALTVSHALGLETKRSENSTVPAPIVFTPDQNWDGIDGAWSTFTLRIGTPEQTVRTFVSFKAYQTWAILPEGCTTATDPEACAETRGWLFNQTESSTWDRIGLYDLYIENNLDITGNAIYGYDQVGLMGKGENGPTLQNTTVGALAVPDFYLGVFGVNPKPTNFTSFNNPSPSYMTQLKEQGYIPSISAGYTAGARYRHTGVLASLTLGGYDTSRFIDNDVEFTFASDNERDTLVAIQSISTPSQDGSNPVGTEMLVEPIYALIDSTVSQIWLPETTCQIFEVEFGLTYDNDTELYLVNETLHEDLVERNASITFTLGQSLDGGDTVQITLPYAAFDLTATPPYVGNESYYFPLRRAANDTQYTLGRTFLQEAYFAVDWERQRFNVSQVNWDQDLEQHIVAIPEYTGKESDNEAPSGSYPGTGDSSSSSSSDGGISGGAIAGIVVGVVVGGALILGPIIWFCLRRRRRRNAHKKDLENEKLASDSDGGLFDNSNASAAAAANPNRESEGNVFPKAELEGSSGYNRWSDASKAGFVSTINDSSTGTPATPSAPSHLSGFFRPGSSAYSPSSPTAGEGTHSSSNSGGGASSNPNRSSWLSPLTPASEADSRERQVFEMPGDMPTIKEKDGKTLSEKEALAYRERLYNGVEVPPSPDAVINEGAREPRRINPEDVVSAGAGAQLGGGEGGEEDGLATRHRAFSFEDERPPAEGGESRSSEGSEDLYSASR